MFTVEIKINGSLIAHVYGVNQTVLPTGLTRYGYEVYEVASRKVTTGTVEHLRLAGIVPLISTILDDFTNGEETK